MTVYRRYPSYLEHKDRAKHKYYNKIKQNGKTAIGKVDTYLHKKRRSKK